jgi:hypothetical protein
MTIARVERKTGEKCDCATAIDRPGAHACSSRGYNLRFEDARIVTDPGARRYRDSPLTVSRMPQDEA